MRSQRLSPAILWFIVLAAVVLLVPTTGYTQTIYGCVGRSGSLRIVAAGTPCTKGETPLAWNQTGPPGPEGPKGEPGQRGPSLMVLDVNDTPIGLFYTRFSGDTYDHVVLEPQGRPVAVLINTEGFPQVDSQIPMYYTSADCSGEPYTRMPFPFYGAGGMVPVGARIGQHVVWPEPPLVSTIVVASMRNWSSPDDTNCSPAEGGAGWVGKARWEPMSVFSEARPPLRVVIR
jgi:hypothetical protein